MRHHLGRVGARGLLVRLGEVEVADHDGGLVAERGRDRRPATAQRRPVDHVVVHERRRVRELHRDRGGSQQPARS